MAKTYYNPNDGKHYYHGENFHSASSLDEVATGTGANVNQYNFTPGAEMYREYIRELEEEEKKRQAQQQAQQQATQQTQAQAAQQVTQNRVKPSNVSQEDFDHMLAIEDSWTKGKAVSTDDEAFYSNYMLNNLDDKTKAIIDDYKNSYSNRNSNYLTGFGAAMTNAQNPFNTAGAEYSSKAMSNQMSMSDLKKELQKAHPDWDEQTVRNYLGYAERVTDKEDTDKWINDFAINDSDSKTDKAIKAAGNYVASRAINGGLNVLSTPETVANMASGALKAAGKYTNNEDLYNFGENAGKLFDPNRPTNFGQNTNSVYNRFKNVAQGEDEATGSWLANSKTLNDNPVMNTLNKATQFATGQNLGELGYNIAATSADSAITMMKGEGLAAMFGFSGANQALSTAKNAGQEITKDMKKAAQAEKFLRNIPLLGYVTSGYNSTYNDMKNTGNMSEEAAQTVGLIGGLAEYVTEQIGLDTVFDLVDNPAKNGKQFVKALKSFLAEGSEEGMSDILTDIAQLATDKIDPNSDSRFATLVKENTAKYMEQGMSEEDAKKEATKDAWMMAGKEVIQDSIVGGLSMTPTIAGMSVAGSRAAKAVDYTTDTIKSNYENVENTGDTSYDKAVQADKSRYENNPVQFIADNINDSNDYGKEVKAEVQKLADKVNDGKKLTKSDKVYLYENLDNNMLDEVFNGQNSLNVDKANVPNEHRTAVTNMSADEAQTQMIKAANEGDLDALSDAYNLAKNSRSAETRNAADEIVNSPVVKGQLESKGIAEEEISQALVSTEEAYKQGLAGDEVANLSSAAQNAYNDGKLQYEENKRISVGVDSERAKAKITELSDAEQVIYKQGMKEDTNANQYNMAWDRFYNAGQTGLDFDKELNNRTNQYLSDVFDKDTLKSFYDAGAQATQVQLQKEATKGLNDALGVKKGSGTFTDARSTKNDDVDYEAFRFLANFTGQDIVLANFDSGNFIEGENAHFDAKNSKIYINADESTAQGFHEALGEFTEFYNAEGFETLRKSLNQAASEVLGATKYNSILSNYAKAYGEAGQSNTGIEMSREMTNDLLVAMMDTKAGREKLARTLTMNSDVKTAENIVEKIKSLFNNIAKSIRSIMDNSRLNRLQREMLDNGVKELEDNVDLFIQEFRKARENAQQLTASEEEQAVNEATNPVGIAYDSETESAYPSESFSLRTWDESEYVKDKEKAAEELHNALNVSKKKALKYINDINSIAKMIADDRTRLDYDADEMNSSFVRNAEYGGSIDFSTICKKRLLYTGTMQAIQKQIGNRVITMDDYLAIRNAMLEDDLETTCGCCYVEGSRVKLGQYMKEFIKRYAEDKPKYVPTMYEVTMPDGIRQLRAQHPEVWEAREYFLNHMGQIEGHVGEKNLFGSHGKPKDYTERTEYKGEILKKFLNKKDTVKEKNKNGGLRLQSFSDFEIVNLIDCMQVITDMSRCGLAGQAYTKVKEFADALGNTGLKINLSLMGKGVDADGNLILDEVNGMKKEDALYLRNKYSANVGTIIVCFNDEQIKAAMKSDYIDFIIPFHRSQWRKSQYDALGLPTGTRDYTKQQNDRMIKDNGRLKKADRNYMPNEYWDFSKTGRENAEKYIDMCNKDHKAPKFAFLLEKKDGKYVLPEGKEYDGYFKLLIDFKMYDNDGVGAEQKPVQPIFSMDECKKMLEEYTGGHDNFPVNKKIADQFAKKIIARGDEFSYSLKVDSEDNSLTDQQVEYFKDSQVRDSEGRLKPVYHGTGRADRVGYLFDPKRATSGPMAFFTDDQSIAENYSKSKADTSMSRDERYNSYYTQFRMNIDGKDMSIGEAWNNLPAKKRAEIKQKAAHITFDDDYENIIYDENATAGLGNFDQYKLREHNNNYLNALVSAWLEDGDLYDREADFLEVLKLVGLDNVEYLDPDFRDEKVYKVYMNMTKPFTTETSYTKEFIDGLKSWWDNADQSKYDVEDYAADGWDKTGITVDEWIKRAEDDIAQNTTYAWTIIPDAVTDYLKSEGYDGIEDQGGKYSGIGHTVYIPFYSNQIKDVANENPTENDDIRYSLDVDEIDFFSMTEEDIDRDLESVGIPAYYRKEIEYAGVFKKKANPDTLRQIANKLRKEYGSTYNLDTFVDNLQKFFDYANKQDHVSYEDFTEIMNAIARPFVASISEKANPEEYKRFVDTLKGYGTIQLTSTQIGDVRHQFGNVKTFRSMMMPIANISSTKGISLDSIWSELCDNFGGVLNRDASEGEMPSQLYDALQAFKAPVTAYGGQEEDVARDVTLRILEEYLGGEQGKKIAERNKAYKQKLQDEYEKKLKRVEGRYNAKIIALKKNLASRQKDRQTTGEKKKNIWKNAKTLQDWASKPTKEKHIPRDMVSPIMEFLTAFDFAEPNIKFNEDGSCSTRVYVNDGIDADGVRKFHFETIEAKSKKELLTKYNAMIEDPSKGFGSKNVRNWKDRMQSMKQMFDAIENTDQFENTPMAEFVQRLSPNLGQQLADLLSRGATSINNLDSKDMTVLDNILRNIITAVNQGNQAYSSGNIDIATAGQDIIKQAESINRKSLPAIVEQVKDMLDIDMLTPRTAFSLLGNTGDKLYKLLREGFNTKISDVKKASEFMESLKDDLDIKDKEISSWGGKKALIKEFNLGGGTVRMTDLQIMALYETCKQPGIEDRMRGGFKIKPIERNNGIKLKQNKAYHLNMDDVNTITATLSEKQKKFADQLQQYMAVECAKAGNEVSMAMYGYEMFINPSYFPLEVDKKTIQANDKNMEQPKLTSIRNAGFTNARKEGATNPLMIGDILDIFTNHVSTMADYHSYAAPTTDILRWFNYKEVQAEDNNKMYSTVQAALDEVMRSERGADYFKQLLLDINGDSMHNNVADFIDYFTGAFKASSVLANLSVVIQQPFAYARAMNMIDPKYMVFNNPVSAIAKTKKVNDLSPIAWWKAQGYYETSIGRSLKEIITGQGSVRDKINEKAGYLAGKADDITWALLYQAVENEQRDKLKGQNLSEAAFRKKVNDRFDDMIDQTQVVDSTLHRSQYMRSPRDLHKLQTAFMAEPTKSYNMMAEAILKDKRSGEKNYKRTARAIASWAVASIMTAAAKSLVGAMRKTGDDDDYWDVYLEQLLTNIEDNLDPFQMIPWVKDVESAFKNLIAGESSYGTSYSRYDLDGITELIESVQKVEKYISGDSKLTPYGIAYAVATPISKVLGVPIAAAMRDTTAIYNMFFDDIKTTVETTSTQKTKVIEAGEKQKSESDIERYVTNALDNGSSINDIQSYIASHYKNDYKEAVENEDSDSIDQITEEAKPLLIATGMTVEEADAEISSWSESSEGGYNNLDKLIKSDDAGIEDEVNNLLDDGKDPDRIVEHIMNGFGSTVEYERSHNTNSNYEDAVTKALQVVDPSYTYDSVKADMDQKAQEKAEKAEADAKVKELKTKLFTAIDANNGSDMRSVVNEMVENGKDAKAIKNYISTEYHDRYISTTDSAERSKIRQAWINATTSVNNILKVENASDPAKTWDTWAKDK